MRESYSEEVATHTGPESCGCGRKGAPEALTGEGTGRVSSLENALFGSVDAVDAADGNTTACAKASTSGAPRGRRPRACAEAPCTEAGRPHDLSVADGDTDRAGNSEEEIQR